MSSQLRRKTATLVPPSAERSRLMSRIRSRDTGPEMLVRRMLYANGYRFRCQWKGVPGHPDVAIPRLRTLIEIRGCFWHRHAGCADATTPKTNVAFWREKFRRNVERDARHEKEWSDLGWNLIVVWTCGLVPAEREKTFRFILRTLERWGGMSSSRMARWNVAQCATRKRSCSRDGFPGLVGFTGGTNGIQ